jgi:phage/plasmid-associated DNA primase
MHTNIAENCALQEEEQNAVPHVDNTPAGIERTIQLRTSKPLRLLTDFLAKGAEDGGSFATEKGDQHTNILNPAEKKTFYLPTAAKQATFFKLYEDCRLQGGLSLHYSERQINSDATHTGIMVDFDIYQPGPVRQLDDKIVKALCEAIVHQLFDTLDWGTADKCTNVFVISKPAVAKTEKGYKDGLHILCPEIQVTKAYKKWLLARIKKDIDDEFANVSLVDPNVIDMMSASVPVYFVGSCKPGSVPYVLSQAFTFSIGRKYGGINSESLDVAAISSGNSPGKNSRPINLAHELSLSFTIPFDQPHWLEKRPVQYLPTYETEINTLAEKTHKELIDEDTILESNKCIDNLALGNAEAMYVKKLLELLDLSYATEYIKWFKVICAIAHTSRRYKPLAEWFSQRAPELYSSVAVDKAWNEVLRGKCDDPITLSSLEHWAHLCSPIKAAEIKKENHANVLARAVYENDGKVEHAHAAAVLAIMLHGKFVTDDTGCGRRDSHAWYEFVTDGQKMRRGEIYKWRQEPKPDNLHLYIAEALPAAYAAQYAKLNERVENATEESLLKYLNMVRKTFKDYKTKLGNNGFQEGIVKQCAFRFRQRGFLQELDAYPLVLGVGNGILKIGRRTELITGFHEYRISKFTEVCYVPWDVDCPRQQALLSAFRDIFPEPDVFLFCMIHAATALDLCESANLLLMLVGGGSNGKSFYLKMIHNTVGSQYCSSGKASLLTGAYEKGNEANSAQMHMKGKRYFYFEEFTKAETLNNARLKTVIGSGWQSGRDLHGKQENFINTCNPVIATNFELVIDAADHGTWRRLMLYRCKTKFCDDPDPKNPREKKADPRIIRDYPNDPDMLSAMLAILTHFYEVFVCEYGGLLDKIPVPTILQETLEYRNRQDSINKFIMRHIVTSPGSPDISMPTLVSKYREWYFEQNHRHAPVTDVEAALENSRLAPHFQFNQGMMHLQNHRIRVSLEEPLGELESVIVFGREEKPKKIVVEEPVQVAEELDDDEPLFGGELFSGEPLVTQHTVK